MQEIGPNTHVMICAGEALTASLKEGLLALGLPPSRLHIEAFSLALAQQELEITVKIGAATFRPKAAGSLLDVLEQAARSPEARRQGARAPLSECRVGDCALCSVEVLEGRVRDLLTGEERSGRVLACSVLPITDLVLAPLPA